MKFVFWQNCISPHQIPYIKELCKETRVEEVCLVVPRTDYNARRDMGWNAEEFITDTAAVIQYHLNPNEDSINKLLKQSTENTFHFFSGIRADKDVYSWFLLSLQYNLKRGIITEAPYTYDKPLWMHYLRFWIQDRKYIPKIDYVFAIGTGAVSYYKLLSRKWKVIPFLYCTESFVSETTKEADASSEFVKLVYVGSLSKRKNVITLLKSINLLPDKNKFRLDIIGDGLERDVLNNYVLNNNLSDVVTFRGTLSMSEVNSDLKQYDVLVLPSLYDGWGAVVNEALSNGLYVICSDKCGAKTLLNNSSLGLVSKTDSVVDLKNKLTKVYENIDEVRSRKLQRREWAKNISGEIVAKYFIDNLIDKEKIIEPWLI